jgi:hypothetical protein
MAVIINDFEIEVEPPQQPQARGGGGSGDKPSGQQSKLKPEQVTTVMRVNQERMERVRAD